VTLLSVTPAARAARALTFTDVISAHGRLRPRSVALAHAEGEITYGQLAEIVTDIARGLATLGLPRGRPLAVVSENRIEYALLLLACATVGTPVATINSRLPPGKVLGALRLVQPAAIAVSAKCASLLGDARSDEHLGTIPLIALDADVTTGSTSWSDLATPSSEAVPAPDVEPEDILTIMYTSGSSGDPKAVAISHAAMTARAHLIAAELGVDGTDAFLGWAPMFHIASTDYLFVTCFLGGTYVVMPRWDAAAIAEELRRRDIGWLMVMPGLIVELLEAVGDKPVRRIKHVGVLADLVPPEQLLLVTERLGATYLNSFGSTEAGLVPGASAVDTRDGHVRLDKIPTRFCQFRLVDDGGLDVAVGEVGELLLRAPTMFSGYWGDEKSTAAAFRGGWFHSGDLMRLGSGGTLTFVDRVKYIIKTGGENVYPSVIERTLLSHPAVIEAVAVRHPHPRLAEAVRVVVAARPPAPSAMELITFAGRDLARYELPRWIEFVDAGDLPRNVTGKVERSEVEKWPLTVPELNLSA